MAALSKYLVTQSVYLQILYDVYTKLPAEMVPDRSHSKLRKSYIVNDVIENPYKNYLKEVIRILKF